MQKIDWNWRDFEAQDREATKMTDDLGIPAEEMAQVAGFKLVAVSTLIMLHRRLIALEKQVEEMKK